MGGQKGEGQFAQEIRRSELRENDRYIDESF